MRILLGICGGIAAYKSAELVRLLVKDGFDVSCVLTAHATHFVTPLTLATISGKPVLTDDSEFSQTGAIEHISLAEKADLILVAPATANMIAKIANGIADDLLSTLLLAAQRSVAVCPAMNVYMWENPATVKNIKILEERGIFMIGPSSGSLACGYEGFGRMEDPGSILEEVRLLLDRRQVFSGKKILITAGPTREFLDPVRFFSNPSSGRMGYALARAALQYGAEVTLITGPAEIVPPYGADVVRVVTAKEMAGAVMAHFSRADVFISAAAVSDWRPKTFHENKQKKNGKSLAVDFEPTTDILASVSKIKTKQILVGFALETDHLIENAKKKLKEKKLNLIVGNLASTNGKGAFGSEENEMTLLHSSGEVKSFPLMSKRKAAQIILDAVAALIPPVR